jgi:hypothetical protein
VSILSSLINTNMFVCRYVSLLNMFVCRYVVCISFAFTPIAGVQSCAVLMQLLLLLAVCCLATSSF